MTPSTDFNQARPQPPAVWGKPVAPDAVLSAALEHIARGWAVIPVNPLTKIPFLKEWQNQGSHDAAQIRAWWSTWPNAMIGILTGPASGLWVLDVDIDIEKEIDGRPVLQALERQNGKLPTTVIAETPRGGRHFYFQWHAGVRNNAGRREMRGLDWRGEGGFVIVPPSVKADGKAYTWWQSPDEFVDVEHAPQWLLDVVLKKPSIADRASAAIVPVAAYSGGRGYGAAALEAECHELANCASGSRNDQLNRSAFSLAQLVAGGELGEGEVRTRLLEAAGACGLIRDDGRPSVDKTIWSGFNAGLEHPRNAPERPQEPFFRGGGATGAAGTLNGRPESPLAAPPAIKATPFVWRDPSSMPRRRWLMGRSYARRYVSAMVAPGGVGKSSLLVVEALALVTGRDLLGQKPYERVNVWYFNAEDPREETERRVLAAMLHYGIQPEEVEGRLFIDSGRDMPVKLATMGRDGAIIAKPVSEALVASMLELKIGALLVDPFVSTHSVSENDNNAIDLVAKEWGWIAEKADAAIGLAHHSRKPGGETVTTETSRGASALMDAARMGRALNRMTKVQADEIGGIENPSSYFRIGGVDSPGKQNMAPPIDKTEWYQLISVSLGNGAPQTGNPFSDFNNGLAGEEGDYVAVVARYEPPGAFDDVTVADLQKVQAKVAAGKWLENYQSKQWVGYAVAEVLGLDGDNPGHRAKIRKLLRMWIENGALEVYEDRNEKREMKNFVRVGEGQ